MSNSQSLKKAILEYAKDSSTEYAILITGEWGSGKTYFWKEIISPALKKDLKRDSLHISLYGVTSASEIDKLLFFAQHPMFKHGMFEAFAKLSEAALSAFKIKLPTDSLKANISDQILCFDDLERADPKAIPQLLGRINSYVEHDNLKVIIICEENKIQQLYTDYDTVKEKLIGYTYHYLAIPEEVINHSIDQYSADLDFVNYLSDKKSIILSSLEGSGQKNLRTLKQGLKCFNALYKACKGKIANSEPILEQLLILIISLVCELKKDNSRKTALKKLFRSDFVDWSSYLGSDNDDKIFARKYIETYFVSGFSHLSIMTSIFDFITSGVLDSEKLSSELDSLINKTKNTGTKSKEELFYAEFWNLSDDEFRETANEVINSLTVGQKNTAMLLRIFQRLYFFSIHALLKQTPAQLKDIVNQSIDKLIDNNQLVCSDHTFDFPLAFHDGIDVNDPNYFEVRERLFKLNDEIREMYLKKDIEEVLDKLEENVYDAIYSLYSDGNKKYSTIPIFNYYDHAKLIKLITDFDCNDILRFDAYIANRYQQFSNIRDYLSLEISALEAIDNGLKKYLAEHLADAEILKRYCLNCLQKTIERSCVILNS